MAFDIAKAMEWEKKKVTKYDEMYIPNNKKDNVNHPSHYEGKYECIDVMDSSMGAELVFSFCTGNAFKYIWRYEGKNGFEDIKKTQWYINKAIEIYTTELYPAGQSEFVKNDITFSESEEAIYDMVLDAHGPRALIHHLMAQAFEIMIDKDLMANIDKVKCIKPYIDKCVVLIDTIN